MTAALLACQLKNPNALGMHESHANGEAVMTATAAASCCAHQAETGAHFSWEMLAGLRAVFRKADVGQPGWLLSDLPSGKYTNRSHSAMLLHAAAISWRAQARTVSGGLKTYLHAQLQCGKQCCAPCPLQKHTLMQSQWLKLGVCLPAQWLQQAPSAGPWSNQHQAPETTPRHSSDLLHAQTENALAPEAHAQAASSKPQVQVCPWLNGLLRDTAAREAHDRAHRQRAVDPAVGPGVYAQRGVGDIEVGRAAAYKVVHLHEVDAGVARIPVHHRVVPVLQLDRRACHPVTVSVSALSTCVHFSPACPINLQAYSPTHAPLIADIRVVRLSNPAAV